MIKKITIGILFFMALNVFSFINANPACASEIQNPNASYELYRTDNIYNVLKLNTRNGIITQVQIGVNKDGGRMEVYINSEPLVSTEEQQNGRFALYPTGNLYNFILLDRISGRTWQVQWHTKPDYRYITRIS